MKTQQFKKIVEFQPGYDKRTKGCGIASMGIRFVLVGKQGATSLYLSTNWYPDSVGALPKSISDITPKLDCWDVAHHARKPVYEGENRNPHKCEYLGCKCYYDGSSLRGRDDNVAGNFIEHGEDWIWKYLTNQYKMVFGKD